MIQSIETAHRIDGWVVDLRSNGGGNMYPMIVGLGPLIGDGIAGYFVSPKNTRPWRYIKGSSARVKIQSPYLLKNPTAKIAVLIGPNTASSGEMTALSFIGKHNVKLFGQPTSGYTTGNDGFKLSDGAYLYLAVTYTADRNKKKYLGKIDPDILVESMETGNDDTTIETAKKWLLEN